MSTLHPHWQTTENAPAQQKQPIDVKPSKAPSAHKQISRRPAAITGMLVVATIGFSFVQGLDLLTGQIATNRNLITITPNGVDPLNITVQVGDTISWMNNQGIPHIIQSDTLCQEAGGCLRTTQLFEGESDVFRVTPDIAGGQYQYYSVTDASIQGTITVTGAATTMDDTTPTDFDSIIAEALLQGDEPDTSLAATTTSFDLPTTPSESQPEPVSTQIADLPRNPYTINNSRIHPFDANGNPIEGAFNGTATTQTSTIFTETRRPLSQPTTGAGMWLVSLLSVGALWWMTKDVFASRSEQI